MSEATWFDSREQAAAESDGGAAGNEVAEASRAVRSVGSPSSGGRRHGGTAGWGARGAKSRGNLEAK